MTLRTGRRPFGLGFGLLASCLFAAGLAAAVTPLPNVEVSSDVTIDVSGTVLDDEVALIEGCTTCPIFKSLGLPVALEVTGLHALSEDDTLFSLETTAVLGGTTFSPEDVILLNDPNGTYSMSFDGSVAGVPTGVRIDAISRDGGDLILSFDTTALLGVLTADDEDLVRWDGALFSMYFDASAVAAVPTAMDVDAAHVLPSGNLLLSFDTSGTLSGVAFDDEDVLEWDGALWAMNYDASAVLAAWLPADLDAFTIAPDQDGDGVLDGSDNCPIVSNVAQADGDSDLVGDACDNCVTQANPPPASLLLFQCATGGQLDNDKDGWGDFCDGDFDQASPTVNSSDFTLFKAAFGLQRNKSLCNPGGTSPCDIYDMSGADPTINSTDFTRFKFVFGATKKSDGDAMDRCTGGFCPGPVTGSGCP